MSNFAFLRQSIGPLEGPPYPGEPGDPGVTFPRIASYSPAPGHQNPLIRQVIVQFATVMNHYSVVSLENWGLATDADVPAYQNRILRVAILNPDDNGPTQAVVTLLIPDVVHGASFTLTGKAGLVDLYGTSIGTVSATFQSPWGAVIDGGQPGQRQQFVLDGGNAPGDTPTYVVDGGTS